MVSDNTIVPVIIGILLSSLWIASRLNFLSRFKNINDEYGILLPSVVFLASPFLSVYIFNLYRNGIIIEFLKSLIPILTFFLGQYIVEKRKNLEKREEEIKAGKIILHSLNNVISNNGPLHKIKDKFKKAKNENLEEEEIKNFCKSQLNNFIRYSRDLKVNTSMYTINYGLRFINYLDKVESCIEKIIETPDLKNHICNGAITRELQDIDNTIYMGYDHIIFIIKDVIRDNSQLQYYIGFLEIIKKGILRSIQKKKLKRSEKEEKYDFFADAFEDNEYYLQKIEIDHIDMIIKKAKK